MGQRTEQSVPVPPGSEPGPVQTRHAAEPSFKDCSGPSQLSLALEDMVTSLLVVVKADGAGWGAIVSPIDDSLQCNTGAIVYTSGEMSCQVINPTLQAIFPGQTYLNILRTLDPTQSALNNVSYLGGKNAVLAQLFYDGTETFNCAANNCTQGIDWGSGAVDWQCSNLQCICLPGSSFCGASSTDLTKTINDLGGTLGINCDPPTNGSSSCAFQQDVLDQLFGSSGLSLSGCTFGECVQSAIVTRSSNATTSSSLGGSGTHLSGGVIAGLAVVGALLLLAFLTFLLGLRTQGRAKSSGATGFGGGVSEAERKQGVGIAWNNVGYSIRRAGTNRGLRRRFRGASKPSGDYDDGKVILNSVSGRVKPGEMMAILGPSGAGKTTLVELLAGKNKEGAATGSVEFFSSTGEGPSRRPRVAFVDQSDILPSELTVREALLFAARLRLPESVHESDKMARVFEVLNQLGLADLADTRIGKTGGEGRGVSGGEMRRISIGLELVGRPEILILDEPTSGLDSVSALKVSHVLQQLARDPNYPTTVIASIHQPSSNLYRTFDQVLVLSNGMSLYEGVGGLEPSTYFASRGYPCPPMYNIADHLLDLAANPPAGLLTTDATSSKSNQTRVDNPAEKPQYSTHIPLQNLEAPSGSKERRVWMQSSHGKLLSSQQVSGGYTTTFLTQLEVLSGREWLNLKRDRALFLAHVAIAAVLGVFCGGLYYKTGITIAGFQSRIGSLFFLGSLISFSALSALYNIVEIKALFLRERGGRYYSPTAWLLSRIIFDVIPLRLIPTVIVSTITYWMAGLSPHADRFFKFLLILVLFSLAMTLFNFVLACVFRNGGIAILLSALFNLFTMTFAGFFVHLDSIPPVLRWLQWLCPLKYALEALSVNEVGSGLMIQDVLSGVPVDVSAQLIMNLLFGFGANNYYRDVLVLFGFVAGFAILLVMSVGLLLRERR
ncbi:hypothetical protein FRB96_005199 [Tulasnella sp. 330]|nr:hypothetical protein FRB96_005199 [Tulasnella sp. 330]KAG8884863.1 hypothetical protein FRB97_003070 [Tulasnella sp. 331]KAG8890121.1 hypothetical protein FRB98_000849 [Tulasnella sp. 332]